MSYVSSVEDVTCDNHGLRKTIYLCSTYMTMAVTPLSFSACPMSHQYVGGCDMWQSRSEPDSISMNYVYDYGCDTSVSLSMSYVSSVGQWM